MRARYFVTRDSNGPTIDRYFKITHNCDIINGHNTSGGIDVIKLREMGMIFFLWEGFKGIVKGACIIFKLFFSQKLNRKKTGTYAVLCGERPEKKRHEIKL